MLGWVGAGPQRCHPHWAGAPVDMGPSLESVCWACPQPGGKPCPQRGSPVGGRPRPASSASGPHTRAVPVEKLRPGPSAGSLPAPTPSLTGQLSSGAACSIFRPLLEGASHLRPEAVLLGLLKATFPGPPAPGEASGGVEVWGHPGPLPAAGLTTATPCGRPLSPRQPWRWRREFPRVPTAADSRLTRLQGRRGGFRFRADGPQPVVVAGAPISQPPQRECWAGPGLAGLGTPAPAKGDLSWRPSPPGAGTQLRGCPGPQTGTAASCVEAVRPHVQLQPCPSPTRGPWPVPPHL